MVMSGTTPVECYLRTQLTTKPITPAIKYNNLRLIMMTILMLLLREHLTCICFWLFFHVFTYLFVVFVWKYQ